MCQPQDCHGDSVVLGSYIQWAYTLEEETNFPDNYQQWQSLEKDFTTIITSALKEKHWTGRISGRSEISKEVTFKVTSGWADWADELGKEQSRQREHGGWNTFRGSPGIAQSLVVSGITHVLASVVNRGNCGQLMAGRQPWVTPRPRSKRPHGRCSRSEPAKCLREHLFSVAFIQPLHTPKGVPPPPEQSPSTSLPFSPSDPQLFSIPSFRSSLTIVNKCE